MVLIVNLFDVLGFTVSCFEAQEVKLHRHFLPVYFVKLNRNDKFPQQNYMGFLLERQSHLSCRKVGSNLFCTLATVTLHSHPEETFHLLLVYRSSALVRSQVPKWESRGRFGILVCCFFIKLVSLLALMKICFTLSKVLIRVASSCLMSVENTVSSCDPPLCGV